MFGSLHIQIHWQCAYKSHMCVTELKMHFNHSYFQFVMVNFIYHLMILLSICECYLSSYFYLLLFLYHLFCTVLFYCFLWKLNCLCCNL